MKRAFFILLIFLPVLCFAQKDERIVTAGSAITETVCALGDCPKIIASDRTSLYPSHIQSLPSIGYRSGINAEGIISLKPTLVVAEKGYVDDAVLLQLTNAGISTFVVERNYSAAGTKDLINKIAERLNKKNEGAKLIAEIDRQLNEAAELLRKSKSKPKVLCVYNRGASSVDVAGSRTFSGILPYVGAEPAITGVEGYKPLNAESMIASNPDYLLMFESGVQSLGGIDGVLKIPGVMQTTAGMKRQVIAIDGIKLSNFGPRFGEAVLQLIPLIHPELQSK